MLARYLLQCEAIEEPISDQNDLRRLLAMTGSMAHVSAEQVFGHGNKLSHNQATHHQSLHLMVAGKRIMECVPLPDRNEEPEHHARIVNSLSAAATAWLRASSCGGSTALLTYRHLGSQSMAPGEVITNTYLLEAEHEYCELKPGPGEQALAAAAGNIKHPVIGDTWLEGGTAMLKPHTRHADYMARDNFSIPQERGASEINHFEHMCKKVVTSFAPDLGEALEDIRAKYHEVPAPHPLEGKSVASPAFVRKASAALHAMPPEARREKAVAALRKAAFTISPDDPRVDSFINMAMTILPSESE